MCAEASTGATVWAPEEFSGPTTPTTALSEDSAEAAFLPVSGDAWSSCGSIWSVQPGMALAAFACLTARSTEFWMPRPSAERSPERGETTPI
jgi:hypothetical protein